MSSPPSSPVGKYAGSSLTLLLDQLLVALSNWIFWLLISKIITVSAIGNATSIYSLVMLTGTLAQLGLEYPLLKNSLNNRDHIFSTSIIIEIALTSCLIPFMVLAVGNWYNESLEQFIWLSVIMLLFYSTSFIARFVLLGTFSTKQVLMIDFAGVIARFVVGYLLVSMGLSTLGILLSFLIQFIVMTAVAVVAIKMRMGFKIGNRNHFIETIKTGLTNAPAKFSRTLILSLSVVLLASFGVSAADVGIFYIALMISIVVGGLASSMAYMVIPTSSESNRDLSSGSIRLALTLTAPLIAALIANPEYILSLIGPGYVSGSNVLILLSLCILPSSIVMLSISGFNNLGRSKELLVIGSLQVFAFIVLFIFLVPAYGILGAAISMLAALIISSIPALSWSDHITTRYLLNSCVAIVAGYVPAYILGHFMHVDSFILIIISVLLSALALIKLKNTSVEEVRQLIKLVIKKT